MNISHWVVLWWLCMQCYLSEVRYLEISSSLLLWQKRCVYICLFSGRSADSRLNRADDVVCKMEKDFTVNETMVHTKNWTPLLRKFIFVGKRDFPEECGWGGGVHRSVCRVHWIGAGKGVRVWPGGGRSFRKSLPQQAFLGFGLVFKAAGRWGLLLWVQVVFLCTQLEWFERVVLPISGRCVWYRPAFLLNGWNLAHGVTFFGEW